MLIIGNEEFRKYVLLALKHRKGGSMLSEKGEKIEWSDADQLVVLPFEDTKGYVKKLTLDPTRSQAIQDKLLSAHWAAVVEVTLNDERKVVDVNVILDSMESLYDEEIEIDV